MFRREKKNHFHNCTSCPSDRFVLLYIFYIISLQILHRKSGNVSSTLNFALNLFGAKTNIYYTGVHLGNQSLKCDVILKILKLVQNVTNIFKIVKLIQLYYHMRCDQAKNVSELANIDS